MSAAISKHLQEMLQNKKSWETKAVLRQVYRRFYEEIRAELAALPGPTVELGSGIGAIKEFIPEAITTDIFDNPWLDRVEDAYRLSFGDGSIANLILFDVFHHLEFPGRALAEFRRVLKRGGRLVLMEPGFGLAGRIVYHLFHHEPVGFGKPIRWTLAGEHEPVPASYYAAQGNAWRIFVKGEFREELGGWQVSRVRKISALSYVASGGFSRPSLFPDRCLPVMERIDAIGSRFPALCATRMLVSLTKE